MILEIPSVPFCPLLEHLDGECKSPELPPAPAIIRGFTVVFAGISVSELKKSSMTTKVPPLPLCPQPESTVVPN
ncbi:hypothetical protein TVAG_289300 [Trichomonas vaginalis G3]|uniref:Uncharacterized protein n=1 Tax=Trichomonas vaginalis (strain ATCC PRA-98 / G3) TaxID=412133 RepID=A2FXL8_TRIV3|nr:hypothetical protein TVAGG3_0835290 [Trichomonas vaginalis G3]EAX90350.1 hypothetical protein TVAG_289300 [Trichomonas vaginalis G3]KAI5498866.1 hypothetical protein TVAGG3_0835290 [Trichomonas vaginalis G3]|eukprot:XP_001303280.1 hypothetical protein [Trichomonas vaginalis G3]